MLREQESISMKCMKNKTSLIQMRTEAFQVKNERATQCGRQQIRTLLMITDRGKDRSEQMRKEQKERSKCELDIWVQKISRTQ